MFASAVPRSVAGESAGSAVAALLVHELERDLQGVALPRPEVQLVARFGPSLRRGLDVHVMGSRQTVHRKLLRGGMRSVTARLQLGSTQAVLGVPASAIAGRIVALEDVWGDAATRRLLDRFAAAQSTLEAATVLEGAIAERFTAVERPETRLVLHAVDRLTRASVSAVAGDLGVSERHLRRLFHASIGVSPKNFAKLSRFRRALSAARQKNHASWATIAAACGYYDQAHLIAEFRAIAGVTPRALLSELRAAQAA